MSGVPDIQLQRAQELAKPPPKGKPYSVPIPGSKVEGRSPVYRHWRFRDGPLLEKLDPAISTGHEAFEVTALRYPKNNCLGYRPYDPVTKTFGAYTWQDYATI